MYKRDLDLAVKAARDKTKDALQMIFDELNYGQQNKILKQQKVRDLLDLYGVNYEH